MLFRAPVIVLAALLAGSALAVGDTSCPAGKYLKKNPGGPNTGYTCTVCAAGRYTSGTNTLTDCLQCPAGQGNNSDHTGCVACTDGTYSGQGTGCQNCAAGKTSNPTHTSCVNCTGETYSTGGTTCMQCPAGQEQSGHTSCKKCQPGEYNDAAGQQCKPCPAGKFTSVQGAKSCCACCAGFYASGTGNDSCNKCGDIIFYYPRRRYSAVGSDSFTDCKEDQGSLPAYTSTCDQPANNACPATTPGGPVGSPVTRKRDVACTKGFTSCPRYSGRGGFDCVDTQNDPESCGGCIGLDGSGSGTDCTAIHGTSVTRCVKGSCVIDSCRKGWVKSLDGSECVLASRATGSPGSDVLHAQNAKSAKRASGKRAIRHNIF